MSNNLDKKLALAQILDLEVKEINSKNYIVSPEIEKKAKYRYVLAIDEQREVQDEMLSDYYEELGLNIDSLIEEDKYVDYEFTFEGDTYHVVSESHADEMCIETIINYLEDESRDSILRHYVDFDDIARDILSNDGYDSWYGGEYLGRVDGYEIFKL